MEKRTTIELAGKEFPFYRTNRGKWDYEAAGFNDGDLKTTRGMIAWIYYTARDCAKRAKLTFPFENIDAFVDGTDRDIFTVFERLAEKTNTEEEPKPGKS